MLFKYERGSDITLTSIAGFYYYKFWQHTFHPSINNPITPTCLEKTSDKGYCTTFTTEYITTETWSDISDTMRNHSSCTKEKLDFGRKGKMIYQIQILL